MPSIKETKTAINAFEGMTCTHEDGEWRVTLKMDHLRERYPNENKEWLTEKQESIAYYTNDADDAISTAELISKQWLQLNNQELKSDHSNDRHISLNIHNTSNAAFLDTGRLEEVARIVSDAGEIVSKNWEGGDEQSFALHDLNGNTVGEIKFTTEKPEKKSESEFQLDLKASFKSPEEVVDCLTKAADKISNGDDDFTIYDLNGNSIGKAVLQPSPSLMNEGVIDMRASIGDVYLADEYSLADGQYRYVIPANDFEPGYHQGQGDAWLVNAKGEPAPGYEDPQTVRETDIRILNNDERAALLDVVEGRVTFEDYESRFEPEGLEP